MLETSSDLHMNGITPTTGILNSAEELAVGFVAEK